MSDKAKEFLKRILSEIQHPNGNAAIDRFGSLRDVDAKVREVKMLLGTPGFPSQLLEEMQRDGDFEANSRRVRLEALANYCRSALRFLDSGVVEQKKRILPAPDISELTAIMPNLEDSINSRWLEAQKCQYVESYLASIILMGSILEALLLARASMSPSESYQAKCAPKDKKGKSVAIHDWNLNTLIDVAVELNWLKTDRGKFSHALRGSRNAVHPWVEVSTNANFDEATCKTSWEVLKASVNDLLASI
jgi:hypothetical protein